MPAKKRIPKSKRASPDMTRQERSALIGVSVQSLANWERGGVNVWDDGQVREKLARMRNLPPTLKPEWLPQVAPAAPASSGDDPTSIDIEAIIRQLSTVTDKHQAQTVKTQIDGLLNAYKLREAAGKYVSKATVDTALVRIAAAVKAAILRMEADLPPQLEGADPPTMQRIIRGKVDEVMAMLSDESSKIWEADDPA
jgi:transcriptional regulator with XRE-family HTH domain